MTNALMPPPSMQPFPSFTYSASAWAAAGYANQITDNDCNEGDPANVYKDLASMASQTAATVIQTSCAVSWSNNSSLTLRAPLAVIAAGGFSSLNRFTVSATGSSTVDLFLIVPSSVTCTGTTGAISFSNNTSFDQPVDLFVYSPCDVTFSNNEGTYGQIYSGGNLKVTNQFTMTYVPLALPSTSGVGNPLAFVPSIVYDRQVAPGT